MSDQATSSVYVCYLSLEDPLVATQVVAYLEGLAQRGHRIHLLTFDGRLDAGRREHFATDLRRRGIAWHSLRYHRRPSLPATVYDALMGAWVTARLVRRHGLEIVHARGHVPAASALLARRLTGARLIFDIRGLIGEEYVDAGRWKPAGLPFRLTKRIERAALRRAAGVVVLTERVRRYLFGDERRESVHVIPCCADLDAIDDAVPDESRTRQELELSDRPVLVYVGKFTGSYLEREMVEFFSAARKSTPDLLFLVLTQADPAPIIAEFGRQGIPDSAFRITRADPREIGRYLAVADYGIAFYEPGFSRIATSPTKVGEYLGAGLPVLASSGIGDVDHLLSVKEIGVSVNGFSPAHYTEAARRIQELVEDPGIRDRCRAVAGAQFSLADVGVPRYDHLYRQVANADGLADAPHRARAPVGP